MDTPHAETSAAQAALFADLCDYTRLTEELGDAAAAHMALELRRINGREPGRLPGDRPPA